MSNAWKLAVAVLALLSSSAFADPVLMIGHVDDSSARVWAHGASTNAAPIARQGDSVVTGRWDSIDAAHAVAVFAGLLPATDTKTSVNGREVVFRTAPAPALTGRVTFADGSCNQLFDTRVTTPLFDTIADARPDFMLWLGDNWYYLGEKLTASAQPKEGGDLVKGEWSDPAAALGKAHATRLHPSLRKLLTATSHVATWDDHDFGYNNAPAGDPPVLTSDQQRSVWIGADRALDVFRTMWANPPGGGIGGTYFSFRRGPVAVFVLDGRFWKDVPAKTTWGRAQLDALKAGLLDAEASGVAVKFIANGSQVMVNSGKENLRRESPAELDELLAWIDEKKIGGVVFLSGDRHRTELYRFDREGGDILEFTASPFHHTYLRDPDKPEKERLWVGPKAPSFGLVTVDIQAPGQGTITLESRDATGNVLVNIGGEAAKSCRTVVPLDGL